METQMNFKYSRHSHTVGDSMWHLEWCPKYRYEMFRKLKYKNLAEGCIRKAANEHKIEIIELSVMPDHVHCEVSIPLTMTPSKALQLIKGRRSYVFFRAHPRARLRYPQGHLWSRGKFAASIGYSDVEKTRTYIRNQEIKHGFDFLQ